ncbi:predicted protein [Scheffersomyces stipitis CBS 6054]|uniref:Zn(2)-C6 fungal-type domain-containing protein n=1 Tax=Scheffersomyces stipitis (strain ATCC 58785 / CBS 6054 / NBRC 10063 / NRRL Y-11545) TaxID=322104 RepID=A3M006_PICST|nr:predicted protein [Scheffersomyces stipitis CBS 6054]ABN68631.2 predicted protein [Scheffersomyces stipitis CBS 6054]
MKSEDSSKSPTSLTATATPSPTASVSSKGDGNGGAAHDFGSDSYHDNFERIGSGADKRRSSHNKPKRQRRSYSCGPCKLLKIKCDLQIPCSSCKKFKRVDKCILQPPQPPSEEELYKIKERKRRTSSKKTRLNDNFVQAFNLHKDSLPSLGSTIGAAKHWDGAPSKHTDSLRHPAQRPVIQSGTVDHSPYVSQSHMLQNNQKLGLHLQNPQNQLSNQDLTRDQTYPHNMFNGSSSSAVMLDVRYPVPPSSLIHQPNQAGHALEFQMPQSSQTIAQQYEEDESALIEMSMVDTKRMKRLLPDKFSIFEDMMELYLKSTNDQILDLINHNEMSKRIHMVYNRIVSIDDEGTHNISKSVQFSVQELRHMSFAYLILANGYLFENKGLSNFLFERNLYKPKKEILSDWVKISNFIKTKVLSYAKYTDLLFLMDWYFLIKNYYTYCNMIVENYLEYNNLLNHVVLNNQFVELMEDPEKDYSFFTKTNGATNEDGTSNQVTYPKSYEFILFAGYWMQLRLVEIEFTFFQYKGSLLSSNQLKNTIVPHKMLLQSLYGQSFMSIKRPLVRFSIQIWGLYYKRSRYSTSIRDVIRSYLELYAEVQALAINEIREFEANIKQNPNHPIGTWELNLLIKNSSALNLFIRWLSFIRIEANYFPSLRYTSYLTSMMNLFNQFDLMDSMVIKQTNGERDLISVLLEEYPYHYMKCFYQCLIYQALFLIVLEDFIKDDSQSKGMYKLNLEAIFVKVFGKFISTVHKFYNHSELSSKLHIVGFFACSMNLIMELTKYLQMSNKPQFGDFTDLIYDLKVTRISNEDWDILLNFYFGSRENFMRYIEKAWDLFAYMKIIDDNAGQEEMMITPKYTLNDELIEECSESLVGFEFDSGTVNEYMKCVVEPNTQE